MLSGPEKKVLFVSTKFKTADKSHQGSAHDGRRWAAAPSTLIRVRTLGPGNPGKSLNLKNKYPGLESVDSSCFWEINVQVIVYI